VSAKAETRRGPRAWVLSSAVVHPVTAALLVYPVAVFDGVLAAVFGAGLGVMIGTALAERTRLRLPTIVGSGVLCLLLVAAFHGGLVGSAALADALGPVGALRAGDAAAFGLGAFIVSSVLRALAVRRPSFTVLEVAMIGVAFASLLVGHRRGAIHRPYEIADRMLASGNDPTLAILAVGALAALLVGLLLLRERRFWRAGLHFAVVAAVILVIGATTAIVGTPVTPAASDALGLRDDDEESRRRREGRGDGDGDGQRRPDSPEFRDDYEEADDPSPVGVVILHDDYSSPTGVYYFRQDAFSAYNGQRLVSSARADVDRDVGARFPSGSRPTEIEAEPAASASPRLVAEETPGARFPSCSATAPTRAGDVLLVSSFDGTLRGLDPRSLEVRWQARLPAAPGASAVVLSEPLVLGDGRALVAWQEAVADPVMPPAMWQRSGHLLAAVELATGRLTPPVRIEGEARGPDGLEAPDPARVVLDTPLRLREDGRVEAILHGLFRRAERRSFRFLFDPARLVDGPVAVHLADTDGTCLSPGCETPMPGGPRVPTGTGLFVRTEGHQLVAERADGGEVHRIDVLPACAPDEVDEDGFPCLEPRTTAPTVVEVDGAPVIAVSASSNEGGGAFAYALEGSPPRLARRWAHRPPEGFLVVGQAPIPFTHGGEPHLLIPDADTGEATFLRARDGGRRGAHTFGPSDRLSVAGDTVYVAACQNERLEVGRFLLEERTGGAEVEGYRVQVEHTVALLADHARPFGLEAPFQLEAARNPNPQRFRRMYRVRSVALDADFRTLLVQRPGNPTWTAEQRAHYLDAPGDPRYRQLAERVIDALPPELEDRPMAAAFAITQYLGANGTYSLRSRHADAEDPTAHFLFGDLTGYCVHFAHAAVFLMRSVGIPARLATGYAVSEANRQGGSAILLRSSDSHAWPEVYVEGVGWVVMDVAVENVLSQPPAPPDPELQRLLGELARGLSPVPDLAQHPPRPIAEILGELVGPFRTGVGLFLLVVLLVGYGTKLYRRLAPRFGDEEAKARTVYRGLLDQLVEAGLPRRYGESREGYARRLRHVLPSWVTVTNVHLQGAFGHGVDAGDVERMVAHGGSVVRELRAAVPAWRRLLGLANPFSWLLSR
jgi:transglutaminase-like putative cysteine protease